jgi:MOSC domain-containing protein YiiM
MPREGIFVRVIAEGEVKPGDVIQVLLSEIINSESSIQ